MNVKRRRGTAPRCGFVRCRTCGVREMRGDYPAAGEPSGLSVTLDATLEGVRQIFHTRGALVRDLAVLRYKADCLQARSQELQSRLARLNGILLEIDELLRDAQ